MKKVVHWSHNWLIGAVAVRPRRWPNWVLGLPVLFTLYRKRGDCDGQHPFQTRGELAAGMIRQARAALPQTPLCVVADGQYATQAVAAAGRECQVPVISRIRTDAALYALPPKQPKRRCGPRARRGRRLPTPPQMAARRQKGWHTVRVLMYGRQQTRLVLPVKCLWWHVCGETPVKLLIVRDPAGKEKDQYLVCTDASKSDREILRRFAARWPVEQVIREGKQIDQVEHLQGFCARTVLRQLPLGLIGQTLVKVWYLRSRRAAGIRHAAGFAGLELAGAQAASFVSRHAGDAAAGAVDGAIEQLWGSGASWPNHPIPALHHLRRRVKLDKAQMNVGQRMDRQECLPHHFWEGQPHHPFKLPVRKQMVY